MQTLTEAERAERQAAKKAAKAAAKAEKEAQKAARVGTMLYVISLHDGRLPSVPVVKQESVPICAGCCSREEDCRSDGGRSE